MDNGHRMVVKMALNAARVAKIIYYNVSAKYEHMLASYLVEKHRTTTAKTLLPYCANSLVRQLACR
jgi:hypothetical protein